MVSHAYDVQQYINGVLDGSIVTGRLERLAVHRHVDDLKYAGERGFCFDETKANKAIEFARICHQFESPFAGMPLKLRPDQKFLVWCVMGWRQKSDGFRRFRQVQYEVGRKAGKSTMSAYLACLLLFMDSPLEHGAQGYVAATKQKQAKIVWNAALKMIERSPALKKRAKITESKLLIEVPATDSVFMPLAADKTPDGFNPHFIIKDEEHAWRERHRGQSDTLGSGFGTRAQPITITITTYGSEQSTVWKENHDYAVRCLESVITGEIVDDTWFAMIHAVDYAAEHPCFRCHGPKCTWCGGTGVIKPDDPYDEAVWRKANPGIGPGVGFTPQLERVQDLARLAKNRPDKQPEFFQKSCNIIVSSRDRIITAEAWAACRGVLGDWSKADRIHGGIDLGRSNDMAGAVPMARFDLTDDDGKDFSRFEVRARAWTCEDRHEDVKTPQVARWIRDEHLDECTGDSIRFGDVEEWCAAQSALWGVRTWAFDKTFAGMLAQRLQDEHGQTMFPFTQSAYHYNAVTRLLPKLLTETHIVNGEIVRAFVHDGDPVLAWMMMNLIVVKDAKDHWMPDKRTSPQKIDLCVALLMALSECLFSDQQNEPTGKYYETNPLEFA
jgi:phage terminase large subunit-like protein